MNKKLSDFAKDLGAHFAAVSSAHADLADTCEADSPAQQAHQSIAASCGDMADKCQQVLKTLATEFEKTFERDYSQAVPTNVSAVAPNAPGIVAVPRPGAPPAASVKPNVAPEFQKVFSIDDEE
jgi:hypothetical protein